MPSDEYASVGGGLRIKGAKVKKNKKKKDRSDLEKNLSTGESSKDVAVKKQTSEDDAPAEKEEPVEEVEEEVPRSRKTEAERQFEEARKKKVSYFPYRTGCVEMRRLTSKQLLELSESANSRPELMKTHKERVEELNTYLSKLSEHHDMPKIGPG